MKRKNKIHLAYQEITIYEDIDGKYCNLHLSTSEEVAKEEIINTTIKFMKDIKHQQNDYKGMALKVDIIS